MNNKSLVDHFSIITDPRIDRHKKHKLIDIIVISICGMICGCETFVDIKNYGESKIEWFEGLLELPNGIPSHDTIGRVFSLINPLELQKAFYEWTRTIADLEGEIISIDGKYLNATKGATKGKRSIFGMVNAWASNAGTALAQIRTDFEKKDEKQAFKEMIELLEIKGALITLDANGASAEIANKIIDKKGDFLIALKRNQKTLYSNVESLFLEIDEESMSTYETKDKGHGRIEKRECVAANLSETFLENFKKQSRPRSGLSWNGLKSACKIVSTRTVNDLTTQEIRYYVSSVEADAATMLHAARSHWGIENKLHWALDVSFNEDRCRVVNGFAGENLAVIRQLSLNLLKQDKLTKKSIKSKRLICGWENEYLKKIITGMTFENIIT